MISAVGLVLSSNQWGVLRKSAWILNKTDRCMKTVCTSWLQTDRQDQQDCFSLEPTFYYHGLAVIWCCYKKKNHLFKTQHCKIFNKIHFTCHEIKVYIFPLSVLDCLMVFISFILILIFKVRNQITLGQADWWLQITFSYFEVINQLIKL